MAFLCVLIPASTLVVPAFGGLAAPVPMGNVPLRQHPGGKAFSMHAPQYAGKNHDIVTHASGRAHAEEKDAKDAVTSREMQHPYGEGFRFTYYAPKSAEGARNTYPFYPAGAASKKDEEAASEAVTWAHSPLAEVKDKEPMQAKEEGAKESVASQEGGDAPLPQHPLGEGFRYIHYAPQHAEGDHVRYSGEAARKKVDDIFAKEAVAWERSPLAEVQEEEKEPSRAKEEAAKEAITSEHSSNAPVKQHPFGEAFRFIHFPPQSSERDHAASPFYSGGAASKKEDGEATKEAVTWERSPLAEVQEEDKPAKKEAAKQVVAWEQSGNAPLKQHPLGEGFRYIHYAPQKAEADPVVETAPSAQTPEDNAGEAREWIANWRAKQAQTAASAPVPTIETAAPAKTPEENAAEARQWIANWRTLQAQAATSPIVETAPPAKMPEENAAEARQWIANWRAKQAQSAVSPPLSTVQPAPPAKTPEENSAEARQWISNWFAFRAEAATSPIIETVPPAKTPKENAAEAHDWIAKWRASKAARENAAEAREWIAKWRASKAAGENAAEAREWIAKWRAKQAQRAVSFQPVTSEHSPLTVGKKDQQEPEEAKEEAAEESLSREDALDFLWLQSLSAGSPVAERVKEPPSPQLRTQDENFKAVLPALIASSSLMASWLKTHPSLMLKLRRMVAWEGEDWCEGAEHSCDHHGDKSICMSVLDHEGQPLNWGDKGNFWDITNQDVPTSVKAWTWEEGSTGMCINPQSTAKLVQEVGCENVRIRCSATPAGKEDIGLAQVKECLKQKCQEDEWVPRRQSFVSENDAGADREDRAFFFAGMVVAGGVLTATAVLRQRRTPLALPDQLLG